MHHSEPRKLLCPRPRYLPVLALQALDHVLERERGAHPDLQNIVCEVKVGSAKIKRGIENNTSHAASVGGIMPINGMVMIGILYEHIIFITNRYQLVDGTISKFGWVVLFIEL